MINTKIFTLFQGVLLSVPEAMEDLKAMKKLWIHEVLRVYCDRLVDDADRNWLISTLHSVCKQDLLEDMNDLLEHLCAKPGDEVSVFTIKY